MTIPWLMNCAHSDIGWCLDCVANMGNELAQLRRAGPSVPAIDLEVACNIALAISGHFCENPDAWLRNHEKRLRELQKKASAALNSTPATTSPIEKEKSDG